jgi:hypothetical protein
MRLIVVEFSLPPDARAMGGTTLGLLSRRRVVKQQSGGINEAGMLLDTILVDLPAQLR